jgi:hypothetical protein
MDKFGLVSTLTAGSSKDVESVVNTNEDMRQSDNSQYVEVMIAASVKYRFWKVKVLTQGTKLQTFATTHDEE